MESQTMDALSRSLRRWRFASLVLALALLAGLLLGQSDLPLPKSSPKEAEPPPPPRVAMRAPRQVLQPSSDVEATALAIAYDILREEGVERLPASKIGGFAAEILNEFKSKRK